MEILNALDLKAGKKADYSKMGTIISPIQFLPRDEKDPQWSANNIDFLEYEGLRQIDRNARRLMKNYKLAKGIIDKNDYIVETDNEYSELVGRLTTEDSGAFELKFYPLVPNIVNTMCSEFSKRNTQVTFRSVDEYSYNELLEQKQQQIEKVLISDAKTKLLNAMIEQGLDPDDPANAEQVQQTLSVENLKTLPEIENFYRKDYRSMCEQWAMHQYNVDVERFKMDELEERNFRNSLITDREFWHFRMMEDDFDIEIWNPVLTFYFKGPETRYISQGYAVGKIEMLTISDVIDKYGYKMEEDQLLSLETIFPAKSAGYPLQGYQNDGTYYDPTKSHAWNTNSPGLAYRQLMSMTAFGYGNGFGGGDIMNWIMMETEGYLDNNPYLLRVTTAYWKSQRKIGHLTKVKESGEVITDVIDENYKVTDHPIYNNVLIKERNKDTLVFGEHIDWIWINEVWGGVKIGPNYPSFWGMDNANQLSPIYLGIDKKEIGPLRFQFKGDNSLYGCKLPVEGCVFSDYNTRSVGLVDLTKPFQIGYNMVNNQIADIIVDELGTIVVFDQNFLPRHSLGEDWGKNNYSKAFITMKEFSMLPLDRSLANTEGVNGNAPLQQLNLEQSARLVSRVNLANYFKNELFSVIGITPQRMGQEMGRQTATGVEQNLNASYAQTETYFIQHSDHLMPRVHQQRNDLAQYYNANKPSVRLQYITTADDKINFEINGTDLLLPDMNIYCTTKASHRAVIDRLKQMAEQNNTSNATIYDLGTIMQGNSISEINNTLKGIEEKTLKAEQAKQEHEKQLEQMRQETILKEKAMVLDNENLQKEKDRRANVLIATIRAAGYGAGVDKDANNQNDFLDYMDRVQNTTEFQETMNFERGKEDHKQRMGEEKMEIAKQKMNTDLELKNIDLKIAEENKTNLEIKTAKKNQQKKK